MAVSPGYRDFVLEQLHRVPSVTTRRMFGAVGIYAEAYFFAIVDDDRLYFKVDDANRPAFERAGMDAFRPYADRDAVMPYYEVPIEVLEDPDELKRWADEAIAAAARAKQRAGRRPRNT